MAQVQGFDDVVFHKNGFVSESSFRNILALHEGTLYAPGPEEGALRGTTRARILEAWDGPIETRLPLDLGGEWIATSVSGICPILEAGTRKSEGEFLSLAEAVYD